MAIIRNRNCDHYVPLLAISGQFICGTLFGDHKLQVLAIIQAIHFMTIIGVQLLTIIRYIIGN